MDQQNIAKAFLSISSPGVYLNVPSKDATKKAIALSRRINKYASDLKAKHPKRFGFFASLPLPDIDAALAEIKYCFHELNPKPDGIVLMSNFYGMYLGDPALDPVYEALDALGVTIFEHPTTPCTQFNFIKYHTNSTAPPVPQKQWQEMNRPAADRQWAAPILDFPFDTTRTFNDLILSKIPTRFPGIKWIMAHAGGGLIPTIDRIVGYTPLITGFNLTEAFMKETLAKNFFFDLTGPWPVDSAIAALLRWVDYTRMMWGSDTPYTPFPLAGGLSNAFDRDVEEAFPGPGGRKAVRAVTRGNAEKLLGKKCE